MLEILSEENNVPIKAWIPEPDAMEDNCREQANHLAQLPFLHQWVCLMPDCHAGKGMPIGGVIGAKDAIIPNAVGTDIGCGMSFCATNIKTDSFQEIQTGNGTIIQSVIGELMRNIPVGRDKHRKPQIATCIDEARKHLELYQTEPQLTELFPEAYVQIGTLGGGNHFIELQQDEDGYLCIMIHSGSRHLGAGICQYFHELARKKANEWHSVVPDETCLAFLPKDAPEGRQYIRWMNLALDYAKENRMRMMTIACESVKNKIEKFTGQQVTFEQQIDCHHNYASLETHYGEKVWVHRKGAICAEKGKLAVIPGAMGSYSYVVRGKGCEESFHSASHGAGRKYSRTRAKEIFTVEQVVVDLKTQGIVLGKRNKGDVTEECRQAYKNIDEVLQQEADLVTPIRKLKTVGVVKG